jgi:hypothetical protein
VGGGAEILILLNDAHEIHARRLFGVGVIAGGEELGTVVCAHGVDAEGARVGGGAVIVGADQLVDQVGDDQLLVDPQQAVEKKGDDDDGHGDAQERHAGREQSGELVEADHADEGEGCGDDRDHAGEVNEVEEDLIEIEVADVAEEAHQRAQAAGVLLDLGQFVDVEDHVEDDVHTDQHQEADEVVLEETGDDVAVE